MITSFFKPKTERKVKPISTEGSTGKRNQADDTSPSNKRIKTTNDESADAAIDELLSNLSSPEDKENTENVVAWKAALQKHFSTPSFARLAAFVQSQRKSYTIFPPAPDVFAALNWTPLDQVKVVIVGQDPYHGPKQAHGLCFSVHKGIRVPPSLRNIYKELLQDKEVSNFSRMPVHGYLERWAKQGILMLNSVMTVKQGEANSHKNRGWEVVTDEIIRAVDKRAKKEGRGVVFLLWGKPATNKCETALGGLQSAQRRHTIICTSHPSPLGATKTSSPFMGSKCFSRANKALVEHGYNEIDWRVDGPL